MGKPSGYHILVPLELSYFRLLQHRAVGKGDCISVEIDRAVIRKAGYCAVPGQIPGAAALNGDYSVIADSRGWRNYPQRAGDKRQHPHSPVLRRKE